MIQVRTILVGTSPLVMKNPSMADPDYEYTEAIARITARGSKMTKEERKEKSSLQFQGSLYFDTEVGPFIPMANMRKCFIQAARIRKLGTAVERAVNADGMLAPVDYKGPRDVRGLLNDPAYRYRTMVNANPSSGKKSMVPLVRPMFPRWKVAAEWQLLTDVLDFDKFVDLVSVAGKVEGLGDNRRNGYGRFTAEVKAL